jgi:hypothetical protein
LGVTVSVLGIVSEFGLALGSACEFGIAVSVFGTVCGLGAPTLEFGTVCVLGAEDWGGMVCAKQLPASNPRNNPVKITLLM